MNPHPSDRHPESTPEELQKELDRLGGVEASLRASEERLKVLLEVAAEGVFEWDINRDEVTWSPRLYEMLRIEPNSVQPSFQYVQGILHPDDRKRHEQVVREHLLTGQPYHLEVRLRRADGEYVWVNARGIALRDDAGQPIRMVGTVADITDRKRAEEALRESEGRYRELFNSMGSGVAIYKAAEDGEDFVFADINPAGVLAGNRTREETVGRSVQEVYPGIHTMGLFEVFQRVWRTGKPEYYPVSLYRDGRISRWFENFVYKLPSGELVAVYDNVTERKQAEEEIRKINAELEQRVAERTAELEAKNRELETFAYSVSHDLKAPLRGIDGYSRLLLEDYAGRLDEEGRTFLTAVRQATVQMNQLIEDLLAYSRLERRSLRARPIDLQALAESLLAEYANEVQARNMTVKVDLPSTSVSADPDGLAMALRNLIDNAFKFTRTEAQPMIEIGGKETETAIIAWVRDNGVGFNMAFHDRIFEIFHRLHRAEEYPGTGIGLALVRKAMARMNGRVFAESTPGKETTFYLEIPK